MNLLSINAFKLNYIIYYNHLSILLTTVLFSFGLSQFDIISVSEMSIVKSNIGKLSIYKTIV